MARGRALPASISKAQSLYDEAIDLELTGWQNAADRIKSAIRNDEFHLYAQVIVDLQTDSRRFYEIYMRLAEEEENMMPPGAFLPLAEKYGLMRDLDRWAVTAVLKEVKARREADPRWEMPAYCLNVARDTISDPYFPDFVRAQLEAFAVPGEALRFELQESDVLADPGDAAHLVQGLARLDCWSVLCGFGRDQVSFDTLKDIPVGFLKIDSSIILKMLRDENALAIGGPMPLRQAHQPPPSRARRGGRAGGRSSLAKAGARRRARGCPSSRGS